jgi:hypothetical protein
MSRATPCGVPDGRRPATKRSKNDHRVGPGRLCTQNALALANRGVPLASAIEAYARPAQRVQKICGISGKTSRSLLQRSVGATVASAFLQPFVTTAGTIGRS